MEKKIKTRLKLMTMKKTRNNEMNFIILSFINIPIDDVRRFSRIKWSWRKLTMFMSRSKWKLK